jgi:hypothetical protein
MKMNSSQKSSLKYFKLLEERLKSNRKNFWKEYNMQNSDEMKKSSCHKQENQHLKCQNLFTGNNLKLKTNENIFKKKIKIRKRKLTEDGNQKTPKIICSEENKFKKGISGYHKRNLFGMEPKFIEPVTISKKLKRAKLNVSKKIENSKGFEKQIFSSYMGYYVNKIFLNKKILNQLMKEKEQINLGIQKINDTIMNLKTKITRCDRDDDLN